MGSAEAPLTMEEAMNIDKEELTKKITFVRLFQIEDEADRNEIIFVLQDRAKEFKLLQRVNKQIRAFEEKEKEEKAKQLLTIQANGVIGVTNFAPHSGPDAGLPTPYCGFQCAGWTADLTGIGKVTEREIISVTGQPLLPIKILHNIQTGQQKMELAFLCGKEWETIIDDRTTFGKSSEITSLINYGVEVNSENAKYLVRFIADVTTQNREKIPIRASSSKLGWYKGKFLPYCDDIDFDALTGFKGLYQSLRQQGSFEKWLSCMKEIRSKEPLAPRVALAASFGSVLVSLLSIKPFIVDLYGFTEGGKTVSLMVACSVWADPDEGAYIGDFESTRTALEVKNDALNNLPIILDDTSKANAWVRNDFETLVYDLSSGKGKSRSNRSLKSERERTWSNVCICNGESALTEYVAQAGAHNRILEILCEEHLFEDPRRVANTVRENFGHAGPIFVDAMKQADTSSLKKKYESYCEELTASGATEKQSSAGAVVLLADELATKHIFKDGKALTVNDIKHRLSGKNDISEGRACYQYLLDTIDSNLAHFVKSTDQGDMMPNIEVWGRYDSGLATWESKYCYFYISCFEKILKNGGFKRRQFTDWAKKEGLLMVDPNRPKGDTKPVRMGSISKRMIALKIDYDFLSRSDEEGTEENPFEPDFT